jgi:hypothetical protein
MYVLCVGLFCSEEVNLYTENIASHSVYLSDTAEQAFDLCQVFQAH